MKRAIALMIILPLAVIIGSRAADAGKSAIALKASVVTKAGGERVFNTPKGIVKWSSSMPVIQGDRLAVTFETTNGRPASRVSVRLDNVPLADLRTPPWKVTMDTSSLSTGRHLLRADVRFAGTPIMYSIAEYAFFVREAPVQVKGTVEEFGSGSGAQNVQKSQPVQMFNPPSPDMIKQDIKVTLHSLSPEVDRIISTNKPITIKGPATFRLDARPGVDRWAYSITRDGRRIAGAGPLSRSVYLEITPKTVSGTGLLPGEVILNAWGIRNDGAYSPPVMIPLGIE